MKAALSNEQQGRSSGRQRIVIADDDPFVRALLEAQLADGFECVGCAADAAEAIALVVAEHPDVVMLDMSMPGGGAMRATVEIRERAPQTAIVILSVNETVGDMIDLLNAGAMTYLRKGIDDHSLSNDLNASITAHRHGGRSTQIAADAPLDEVAGGFQLVLQPVPEPPASIDVTPPLADPPVVHVLDAKRDGARVTPRLAALAAETEDERRAARTREFYAGSASGAVTLVVDDDFRNRFALTALLERGKVTVVPAESGPDGIAVLSQRSDVDLVLMDIMMPDMDGYETMTAIRKMPQWTDLPIIAVTAKAAGSERERCLAAGATDYISKPVDTAMLLDAIGKWLSPARRAQAS
ncbi:MAG: response regulator [Solirubrobacteraceae bacterium]|jgi:CheY-like chemotaxis protein